MKSALLMMAALASCPVVAAQQPDIGPPPGRMVDVGGRRLHLLCSGAGSPTVVLEAGASAFAIDWTLVQREVARTNRVCSYDRAGSGWSDSSDAVATPTADLHALLAAAGETAPFVLVGASLGGILVRVYAADYPEQVSGLVFVDPSTENRLFTMYQGQGVLIAALSAEQYRSIFAVRDYVVPRRPPQTGRPFDLLPAELYALRIKLDTRLIASIPTVVPYDAVVRGVEPERARLARLLQLTAREPHALGDRPVVVLTRGDEWNQEMHDAQDMVAQLSTNARHTKVPGSGHEIHLYRPEAVIQAIADVVTSLRTREPLPPR